MELKEKKRCFHARPDMELKEKKNIAQHNALLLLFKARAMLRGPSASYSLARDDDDDDLPSQSQCRDAYVPYLG
jgi:hypothetical protein